MARFDADDRAYELGIFAIGLIVGWVVGIVWVFRPM